MPILGGVAVLLGTATSALTLVLYGLAATRWVEQEEMVLRHRFGAEWEDYRAAGVELRRAGPIIRCRR